MRRRGGEFQTVGQTNSQIVGQTAIQTVRESSCESDGRFLPSNRSKDFVTTTMLFPQHGENGSDSDIARILSTDQELEWWHSRGLRMQQVESWAATAKCSPQVMLQFLRHFAYEMGQNGREAQIENPENYFFSVIRKAGSYRPPSGYKSQAQRMSEFEQELLEKERAELKKLEEIRRQRGETAFELEFQQILSDEESSAYQELLAGLTEFEKNSSRRIREIGLRQALRIKQGGEVDGAS